MKTYAEKLKDPRWQKKRLEVMQRDNFTCRGCQSTTNTLHVHHWQYEKAKEPWDYPDENLATVCDCCHQWIERLERSIKDDTHDDCLRSAMLGVLRWFILSDPSSGTLSATRDGFIIITKNPTNDAELEELKQVVSIIEKRKS